MYKPDSDFRMSGSAATLVRSFLMYRLEQYLETANAKGKQLIERLCGLDGVKVPPYWPGHCYHQFKVQVDPDLQSVLLTALAREGMPVTQWGYRPVPEGLTYESEESMWPRASRMFDEQFMLFNDAYPLSIQNPEVIDWAADTFIRVLKEIKSYER